MTPVETPKLLAFHGDPTLKARFLGRVEAHREADQLIQGYGYWIDGKGCAVGCTIHGSTHGNYEPELGIPEHVAYLEDAIFEGLPREQAKTWPGRFLAAIPVGADLSLVFPKFAYWLLTSSEIGLPDNADDAGKTAIARIAALYLREIEGSMPSEDEWSSAESAAWSAAWSSAESAAESSAESAAWSAARSSAESSAESAARSAARSAAESAAWSAARSAAESAAWELMASKLLVLLAESEVAS